MSHGDHLQRNLSDDRTSRQHLQMVVLPGAHKQANIFPDMAPVTTTRFGRDRTLANNFNAAGVWTDVQKQIFYAIEGFIEPHLLLLRRKEMTDQQQLWWLCMFRRFTLLCWWVAKLRVTDWLDLFNVNFI
jgi:hypothetical protein